jgi:SAM-dependent methyltransferase
LSIGASDAHTPAVLTTEQIAARVRTRSPFPPERTERLLRDSFVHARAVRFVCESHGASGKAVLDVGCAYGQHLIHFGPGSVGLDAVSECVEFCRAIGLEAIESNAEDRLPVFERAFDAAFCSNILEHLVAPHLFLLRMREVLAPGGQLFVHVPTMPPAPVIDWLVRRTIGHNGYKASEHINAFTPRTLRFTLERAGYIVDDVAFVGARGHRFLGWAEPLMLEIGISALAVARPDPTFSYPRKRVEVFAPEFAG